MKPYKSYSINLHDKWSRGGMPPRWSKTPKLWSDRGHVLNHILGNIYWKTADGIKPYPYDIKFPDELWGKRGTAEGVLWGIDNGHVELRSYDMDRWQVWANDVPYTVEQFLRKADLAGKS